MADSPLISSGQVFRIVIESNGQTIPETSAIISVTVDKKVNRIPYAKIVFCDGDASSGDFPLSNGELLRPGAEITIKAGYGDDENIIFQGIVISQGLRIHAEADSRLVVECKDKSVALTVGRKNAHFVAQKDSDVISSILGNYSNLESEITETPTEHQELIQYYCSDWDFILTRAEINGLVVIVNDGKLSLKIPTTESPSVSLTYGYDLIDFQANMDARTQYRSVSSTSWDPAAQAILQKTAAPSKSNKQGNLTSDDLSSVINLSDFVLQTPVNQDPAALQAWAAAQQTKSDFAKIRGKLRCTGSSNIVVGDTLELKGVGERFAGDLYVSGIRQIISAGKWETEIEFGLNPNWHSELYQLQAVQASGLNSAIQGLHIGVVKQLEADPDGMLRIQVELPLLQANTDGLWARVAQSYATENAGCFFIPEIGDEVILGFINNDPSSPIIIGSVYSSSRAAGYDLAPENYIKALETAANLKLEFDDEKKSISLLTPSEQKVVINDDEKTITLADQNGNTVVLSSSGIALDSASDINLKAKGNIVLEANSNIEISAQADASIEALNVKQNANASFEAKASASAEVSSTGNTTVKGAMVMIN